MSPDQIDTAIAEFCGWTEIKSYPESGRLWGNRPGSEGESYQLQAVPQYHKCLNAIHDAESGLTGDQRLKYASLLQCSGKWREFHRLRSCAMERAHALLRTISK